VPISYRGREYWEGKKIGWRDGLEALWLVARHSLAPADAGLASLRRVDQLRRYNRLLWERMRPWVRGRILEVGSGTGGMSRHLLSAGQLVVSDPRAEYRDLLARLFASYGDVAVEDFRLGAPAAGRLARDSFDTIVCSNVLEHVEDDVAALQQLRDRLADGGRLLLVVPMLPALYGAIDRAIGHYRRYRRAELVDKLAKAGFSVEHTQPMNAIGIPGWWLNSVVLRRRSVPGLQARLNDWLTPWLRLESRLGLPFGMSLLAVATRDDASQRAAPGSLPAATAR
jgi:SAM-dependent methyltransferase